MSFIDILIKFLPVILDLINESRSGNDTATVVKVMYRACTSVPEAVTMGIRIHEHSLKLDADSQHPFALTEPVAIAELVAMLLTVGDRTSGADSMTMIVAMASEERRAQIARMLAA